MVKGASAIQSNAFRLNIALKYSSVMLFDVQVLYFFVCIFSLHLQIWWTKCFVNYWGKTFSLIASSGVGHGGTFG